MSFHVGQKVVCVTAAAGDVPLRTGGPEWPSAVTVGSIYTIRDVDARYMPHYGVLGLRFEEYHHPAKETAWGLVETAFPSVFFRPVIERSTETGMAILRKIADETTKKITERVRA